MLADRTPIPRWHCLSEHEVLANRDRKKARDACSFACTAALPGFFRREPSAAGCRQRIPPACGCCCSGATVAVLLLPPPLPPQAAAASGSSGLPDGLGATLWSLPRESSSSAQGAAALLVRHTRNSYSPQELRSRSMYSSSPNECALAAAKLVQLALPISAPPCWAVALGHIGVEARKQFKQSLARMGQMGGKEEEELIGGWRRDGRGAVSGV